MPSPSGKQYPLKPHIFRSKGEWMAVHSNHTTAYHAFSALYYIKAMARLDKLQKGS